MISNQFVIILSAFIKKTIFFIYKTQNGVSDYFNILPKNSWEMLLCNTLKFPRIFYQKSFLSVSGSACQHTTAAASVVEPNPKVHQSNTIVHRGKPKIPKKEPLVKNFMIGLVDKEFFAFPEVIVRDDYSKLKEDISNSVKYFENQFDLTSQETLGDLKSLGLFGLNVPKLQGGKGYFFSESLMFSEHENISVPLGVLFSSHRSVVDLISECGTDSQKEKYLEKLANGSIIAGEAIYEHEPTNDDLFNTKAIYDVDQNDWILNGDKLIVTSGFLPDLFLVFAQSNPMSLGHEQQVTCAILLVDANASGVTKQNINNDFDSFGNKKWKISFKNVKLDETNIVGGKMQTHKVGEVFMKSSRLRSSLVNLELSKKIINHLTDHCIHTKNCGSFLK